MPSENISKSISNFLTKAPHLSTLPTLPPYPVSWCCKKHPHTEEEVGVLAGTDHRGDQHITTILPYLRSHYYASDSEEELITEHELNGRCWGLRLSRVLIDMER